MIKFHSLPSNEAAVAAITREMVACGYEREEAERLSLAGATIAIATLRTMDQRITDAAFTDVDRTIIQQVALRHLTACGEEAMKVNAVEQLVKMMGGKE